MLRALVIAVGAALFLFGLVVMIGFDFGSGLGAVIGGGLLLLGTLYEKVRYKPLEHEKPGPGWERTAERFFDDDSGKPVTVYVHPASGERRYVED